MQALNVIHERGVLHLDIKPEHIFIDDDMAIEFIDFGASYDVARARQQYSSTSDTAPVYALRDNAHRLITEGYALKEQQFVNEAFDIYTLGRSILTFLYGEDIDDVTRFLPLHKRLPEDLQKLGIMARKMTVNTVDARPTLEQSISELHNLFPHIFAQPVEAAKAEAS